MNDTERPTGQLTDVATGQNLLILRAQIKAAWTAADVAVVNALAYNHGALRMFQQRRAEIEDIMFKLDDTITLLGVK